MYLLFGFIGAISRITSVITSPFRYILSALRLNWLTSLGTILRAPLAPLQRVFGTMTPLQDLRESYADWKEEQEYKKLAKDMPLIYAPGAADYSQIHLVRGTQRLVLHIGVSTFSSSAEITLYEETEHPLTLRFTRVNDAEYGAPFVLHIDGDCEAAVDGRAAHGDTAVKHRSRLVINEDEYLVELYAWQVLPYAPRLEVGWYTDKGPVRHHNEDAIAVARSQHGYLFAVADGVGGGEGGELISEFAVRYLLAAFEQNIAYKLSWHNIFQKAFENINKEARRFGMQSQAMAGTTLTAVVVKGWDATMAHVGDSRLYHVSGGTARQISTDHVRMVQFEAPGAGQVPAQLERSILTQAVGKDDSITPQIVTFRLQPGDHLLLLTDGISNIITPEELATLTRDYRAARLPRHLAQLANERYNADNVTAVHVQFLTTKRRTAWQPVAEPRVYTSYQKRQLRLNAPKAMYTNYVMKQRRRNLWLVLLVLILLVGFVFGAYRAQQSGLIGVQPTATVTPTATQTPTLSATPRPPTATRTPTPTPTVTVLPPTSTLQPLPTSTLAELPPRRRGVRKG
jgi:protein phosphatase